jgi:hypothetical protein
LTQPTHAPGPGHAPEAAHRPDADEAAWAARMAAAAFAVGVLLALPTLKSFFVADDFVSLHAATTLPPWRFLYSNWLGVIGEGGFYRPVFNWLMALCYLPLGLDPLPFRIVLIGLFGLNCALVVLLAHRATGSRAGTLLAGLFWAAHPVHAEAIGWIGSQLEQLCAFFFLLSVLAFDAATRRACGRGRWLAASLGLMALSLGSKEMGIAIPPAVVLWDVLLRRQSWKEPGLRGAIGRLGLWAPYALVAAGYIGLRLAILGGVGGYGDRHTSFGVVDNHLVHYIYFLLQPLPSPWLDRGAGGKALVVVAAAMAALAALWRALELPRTQGVLLGLGWFAVTWMPVATLLRTQYMFLPSVGVALALGGLLGPLLDDARRRGQTALCLAAALAAALWVLYAGNALLAQLKLWEAGGQITRSVLEQSGPMLRRAPAGTVVYFEGLPVNIGVPVFQHGVGHALRLHLGREDLDAMRLPGFERLPAVLDLRIARFFSYKDGQLADRTAEVRARAWPPGAAELR